MPSQTKRKASDELLQELNSAKSALWCLPDPMPAMFADDVDLSVSTPLADLRTTLSVFPLGSLKLLSAALEAGRVIRKQYTDVQGNGCLLNCLDPAIDSKPALLSYDRFDKATLAAARRVVRHWDNGTISTEQVGQMVMEVIEQREIVNAAEDATVNAAQRTVAGVDVAE